MPKLRVIPGQGRPRRRYAALRLIALAIIVGGAIAAWMHWPRTSVAGPAAPNGNVREAAVVEGSGIRLLAGAPVASAFELGTAEAAPARTITVRARIERDPRDTTLIRAPHAGRVTAVRVRAGDRVVVGQALFEIVTSSAAGAAHEVVRAQRPGQVVSVDVAPGESVSPLDDEPLLRVTQQGRLLLVGRVPAGVSGRLRVGDSASVQRPEATSPTRIARLLSLGDPASSGGEVEVKAELDDPDHTLRAGGFAELALALPAGAPGVALVPREALVSRHGQSLVLIGHGPDHFDPVPVQITAEDDARAEVAGALAPGDRLIKGGAIYLVNLLALRGAL